ncbi:MAG: Bax inhibitor-1/YccA family protein [Bacteroidetes bacterium]|nr:MAG: Bax inhibitor-1/YccA family protein [Bacteroidota bacterium]
MSFYKTKNPALNTDVFSKSINPHDEAQSMTIRGTVDKTAFLALLVLLSAMLTWNQFMSTQDYAAMFPYLIGGSVLALITGIITAFNKPWSRFLAPLYCIFEGLALGGLSAIMESRMPGIVLQAITLTLGILFSLLLIYRMGWIKATENFKLMVASATAGIAFYYMISFIGGLFGFHLPLIHDNSTFGIIFTLFVVVIAAMNLVLDFDFIESGAEQKAPKYMEWYAAFGLMVTLIWLYIELLRLLAKLSSRD